MVRNPGQLNLENIVTLQILLGSARVRILTDQEVHGLSTVYQFLVLSPHAIARVVLQPDIIEFTVLLDTAVCSGNCLRGVLPWNPELVNACGTVPPAALLPSAGSLVSCCTPSVLLSSGISAGADTAADTALRGSI